jgi:hypothetical protein
MTPTTLCYVLALLSFAFAAFGVQARVSFRDLGYALLVLSLLV